MVNFDRGMQIPIQLSQPEKKIVSDEYEAKKLLLEQQIAQVKERIARNERVLSGKSYEDVNNKIAALEMKKINSPDPTMIWRWQQQRQDTNVANANVRSNEAAKFANTVDMWVNTIPATTTAGITLQISNINSAIRDGKNLGADVSELVTKKKELESRVYDGTEDEKKEAELETALKIATTSAELIKLKNGYTWMPDQLTKLDTKIAELKKKEKANTEVEAFEQWLKSRGFKLGSKNISPKKLATLKRQYGDYK